MKPALFYAIAREPYGNRWSVVGVTTIDPEYRGHRRQWWGRRADGHGATHGRATALRGRFDLISQAEAVLDEITVIERERTAQARRLDDERAFINHTLDQRIAALVKDATQEA